MAGPAPRRGGMITGINVTPLVDIMLVLLIIFMLTAHLIARQSITVELPQASTGTTSPKSPLSLVLTRDGTVLLNGEVVSAEGLAEAVRAAVKADPQVVALVAGDKDVPYGRVVWLLDVIQANGVPSFSVQIDPAVATPPGAPASAPGSGG